MRAFIHRRRSTPDIPLVCIVRAPIRVVCAVTTHQSTINDQIEGSPTQAALRLLDYDLLDQSRGFVTSGKYESISTAMFISVEYRCLFCLFCVCYIRYQLSTSEQCLRFINSDVTFKESQINRLLRAIQVTYPYTSFFGNCHLNECVLRFSHSRPLLQLFVKNTLRRFRY